MRFWVIIFGEKFKWRFRGKVGGGKKEKSYDLNLFWELHVTVVVRVEFRKLKIKKFQGNFKYFLYQKLEITIIMYSTSQQLHVQI